MDRYKLIVMYNEMWSYSGELTNEIIKEMKEDSTLKIEDAANYNKFINIVEVLEGLDNLICSISHEGEARKKQFHINAMRYNVNKALGLYL